MPLKMSVGISRLAVAELLDQIKRLIRVEERRAEHEHEAAQPCPGEIPDAAADSPNTIAAARRS